MGTFSDFVEITSSATIGAEGSGGTIKVPGGARIIEMGVYNLLATGSVWQIRLEAPGLITPQKYLVNETGALEGTEVGSGKIATRPITCDIVLPQKVSEVTIYLRASVASQTAKVFLKWVA